MKLSDLIKRLEHVHKKVGDVPVFFQDNYNRIWGVGNAVLAHADAEHIEWDESLNQGQVVLEIQE